MVMHLKNIRPRLFVFVIAILGVYAFFPALCGADETNGGWVLNLSGKEERYVLQQQFEEEISTHHNSSHFASLVDSQGQVWDGLPLWYLSTIESGDELTENQSHSKNPVMITLMGSDGEQITLDSSSIDRNNNYILANALNGRPFNPSEPFYPLTLVSRDLTPEIVDGITRIELKSTKTI